MYGPTRRSGLDLDHFGAMYPLLVPRLCTFWHLLLLIHSLLQKLAASETMVSRENLLLRIVHREFFDVAGLELRCSRALDLRPAILSGLVWRAGD